MLLFLLLAACETVPTLASPSVDPSEKVVTVATATWADHADSPTRIEVLKGEEVFLVSDWQQPGDAHEATLLGLTSNQNWTARVVTEDGEVSSRIAFETEGLPADYPQWETEGEPGWQGYMVTSTLGLDAYALIMDEEGKTVWYQKAESPNVVLRARPRADGKGVVYAQTIDGDESGTPVFRWANWDGTIEQELEVPNYTHDFVELADGTIVMLKNDIRELEGYADPIWGNSVAELDKDGTERVLWSTWDDWVPDVDGEVQGNGYWAHSNALDIDEAEETLTMGFRDVSTIIKIDRATGERFWQLGGNQSQFEYHRGVDEPFHHHQFDWVEDDLFIFDNQETPDTSRVVGIGFDDESAVAQPFFEWQRDPPTWSYVLGDVHRRSDESMLVVFTTAGVVADVGPDGETRWELQSRFRTAISYVTPISALPGATRVR